MAGVTLDTGVFIALERRQRRALALWEKWALNKTALTVPAVVIAEWWRERGWNAARLLAGVEIEPVDEALARVAGEVLGGLRLGREHTIDARPGTRHLCLTPSSDPQSPAMGRLTRTELVAARGAV